MTVYWRKQIPFESIPNVKDTKQLEDALRKAFPNTKNIHMTSSEQRLVIEGMTAAGIPGAAELIKLYWQNDDIEILLP